MSKSEINKILESLIQIEDIKYFEKQYKELLDKYKELSDTCGDIVSELEDRIQESLHGTIEGYSGIMKLMKMIWDKANELDKEQFIDWLNNGTDVFDECLKPLDDVLSSWPEYISKKEECDGNNTQI